MVDHRVDRDDHMRFYLLNDFGKVFGDERIGDLLSLLDLAWAV
jgi:hypothetical protein